MMLKKKKKKVWSEEGKNFVIIAVEKILYLELYTSMRYKIKHNDIIDMANDSYRKFCLKIFTKL